MGRQIRFFMINEDEIKFLEFIKKNGDKIIDIYLNKLSLREIGKTVVYTGQEIDPAPIIQFFILSYDSKINKTNKGYLERISSDVIEFSRTTIRKIGAKRIAQPGRIWAEFKYYDENNNLVKKTKRFEEMFKKYRDWIKKNLKPNKDKDYYIADEAFRLYQEKDYKMMSGPKIEEEF